MCGIAGAVGAGSDFMVDPETAESMCRVIRHRGPDDQGIYRSAPATLGMRRLSIIDLEGGHQPMQNEDATVWLVFNGEIYNFQELRRDLEARGHRFRSRSDSEAIVHCYEEYGAGCFARLRGMFAIALWDARDRSLWLARDRLGKKPLFYSVSDQGIAFASEIKSLLEVPSQCRDVVPEAIRDFLTLGYIPAPGSIFRGIEKLLPGHFLVYRQGRVRSASYWELPFEPKWDGTEAQPRRAPPREARRGGADSSRERRALRRLSKRRSRLEPGRGADGASSLEPGENLHDRLPREGVQRAGRRARRGSPRRLRAPRTDCRTQRGRPASRAGLALRRAVRRFLRHPDLPCVETGGGPRQDGVVRRRRRRALRWLRPLPQVPGGGAPADSCRSVLGSAGCNGRVACYRGGSASEPDGWRRRASQPYPDNYLSGVALTTPELAGELLGASRDEMPFARVEQHFRRDDIASSLDRVMAGDIRTYLVDDILVKVDRMSMAHSIEARAPLLDHELVEFAVRMPLSSKLGPAGGKRLLRAVAAPLLPASTLEKRKQGFAIPLARWFRGELKELAFDTLTSRSFRERGVFARVRGAGLRRAACGRARGLQ